MYYTFKLLIIISLVVASCISQDKEVKVIPSKWQVSFYPNKTELHMDSSDQVLLKIVNENNKQFKFEVHCEKEDLAQIDNIKPVNSTFWNITIKALFLGSTKVYVKLIDIHTNATIPHNNDLQLTIVRRQRIIDHVFTGSVALLVSLLYINFGAALDVTVLKDLIRRPVGPVIGFICQFILMPLISYVLGYLLFPNSIEMQLGLFFTGVSPGGGASNIWNVILNGNIDLSVLMTTISNFAAFAMMPLWLFTLGHVIFERGNLQVPYEKIATFAISLVIPLAIGLCIQKWSPRLTRILVRLLKPISTALIIFIVVFAIVTNLYLFKLFSWQIIVAGMGLPWLGYILAWFVAKFLRQNPVDAMTIAIETGIQNTGIAIFLLRFSLPQPEADLTTVIPVSVAIMTPFPLLALYIYNRCNKRSTHAGLTPIQSNSHDN